MGASLFNNKLVVRLNWYEASNEKALSNAAGTALGRTARMDTSSTINWAKAVIKIRNGLSPSDPNFLSDTVYPLSAALQDQAAALMQLPYTLFDNYQGAITGTESNLSKGMEIQMTYNPTRSWTMKLTVGKQESFYSNALGELSDWINYRKPIWLSLVAADLPTVYTKADGNKMYLGNYWDGYGYGGDSSSNAAGVLTTAHTFYAGSVEPEIYKLISLTNTAAPSERKWNASVLTNYTFMSGWLNGVGAGGSYRWADKAVVGYYGLIDPAYYTHPTATRAGIAYPDLKRPIYTPAEDYVDLWISYTRKIFSDKVRMKVQLNVRDAFSKGGLVPILYNYDGTAAQHRIKDPAQWYVTTTFDF